MNNHKGVCCVCGKVYRDGEEPASHGYCDPCLDRAKMELEAGTRRLKELGLHPDYERRRQETQ